MQHAADKSVSLSLVDAFFSNVSAPVRFFTLIQRLYASGKSVETRFRDRRIMKKYRYHEEMSLQEDYKFLTTIDVIHFTQQSIV